MFQGSRSRKPWARDRCRDVPWVVGDSDYLRRMQISPNFLVLISSHLCIKQELDP